MLWFKPVSIREETRVRACRSPDSDLPRPEHGCSIDEFLKLSGTLDMDYQHGLLVFLITAATVQHVIQIRMAVLAHGKEHYSDPFTPHPNLKVRLASGVTRAGGGSARRGDPRRDRR